MSYSYECDYCGDPLCPEICPAGMQAQREWLNSDKFKGLCNNGISEDTCNSDSFDQSVEEQLKNALALLKVAEKKIEALEDEVESLSMVSLPMRL